MKNLSIYFAGTIQKAHESLESRWTEEDFEILQEKLRPHTLFFLNPAQRSDDLSDPKSVFGRDMSQVFLADIVFVDARHRRGLGVGAEMMWAKFHSKPVITLAPEETHYRKTNVEILGTHIAEYVHPFIQNLSDALVTTIEEGAAWVLHWINGEVGEIKDKNAIYDAMRHYQHTQYNHDEPMRELVEKCEVLEKSFKRIPSLIS
ncbi:MAG: hypothetical protein KDK76_03500 [Chlamydiia bacterium]|nr:hypothetical protein [Chlamydiia bacterium]